MNSRIEVEKFEPGTTFENNIKEIKYYIIYIKYNHLKSIYSASMKLSAITSFDENTLYEKQLWSRKIEPEQKFEKTINNIKDNHLKSIAPAATNLSAITSFDKNFDSLSMNNCFETTKSEPEITFENNINDIKAIIWKVSPPLTWIYQLSLWINLFVFWTSKIRYHAIYTPNITGKITTIHQSFFFNSPWRKHPTTNSKIVTSS